MRISEDRQTYLARVIVDGLYDDDLVDYADDDEAMALRSIKKALAEWVKEDKDIDEIVQGKIRSLNRDVPEGSNEWDIMYSKYYEEEMVRRGY